MQVKEGGFDRGDGMDGGAQVKGLQAAAAGVAVGELRRDIAQQGAVAGHRLAGEQCAGFLDGGADLLAAGDFAEAGAALRIGDDHDVAGEERAVGAAEVHQHAVVPGDRDHFNVGDGGLGAHALTSAF